MPGHNFIQLTKEELKILSKIFARQKRDRSLSKGNKLI